MTLFISEGGAELSLRFRHDLDPDPWSVTFGVAALPGDEPLTDWDEVMHGVQEAWENNLRGVTDTQVTLVEIAASIGHGAGDKSNMVRAIGEAGTMSDSELPQNCALLVRKNTLGAGRSSQGRFFWPGMIPRDKSNEVGVLDSGFVTAMNTHFNDFYDDMKEPGPSGAIGAAMYVLHSNDATAPNLVVSLQVDSVLSTQRRRLR